MAQLIQMRQRIKAVETIKKITQAMRLISMSTHSRLRNKKTHLETYRSAFQRLWRKIKHLQVPKNRDAQDQKQHHLIILVGSQKGLCGTFNIHLFKFFEQYLDLKNSDYASYSFIAVGRYAADYIKAKSLPIVASYTNFSSTEFIHIANGITDIITSPVTHYTTATIYSNYPKTFFIQKSQKVSLIPLDDNNDIDRTVEPTDYILEETPEQFNALIERLTLSISLQELLFESLLAEQAARFLSMDAASRNAENLIVNMKLEYNKTRQAAITRELTELSTSS